MHDLPALMALRVQGVGSPQRVAQALGTDDEGRASARLLALSEAGLAKQRSRGGYVVTEDGLDALTQALREENLANDADLRDGFTRFLSLNERFLKIATDWQVRRTRDADMPNDHTDPAYDHAVIDRLADLHESVQALLAACASRCGRLAAYARRLDDCMRRVDEGDHSALTTPLRESYHTVWFELHEDLLLTLGLRRGT